jgi:hypothetical protein
MLTGDGAVTGDEDVIAHSQMIVGWRHRGGMHSHFTSLNICHVGIIYRRKFK